MTKKTLKNLKSVLITLFLACVALFCACSLWNTNSASAEEVASETTEQIETYANTSSVELYTLMEKPQVLIRVIVEQDVLDALDNNENIRILFYSGSSALINELTDTYDPKLGITKESYVFESEFAGLGVLDYEYRENSNRYTNSGFQFLYDIENQNDLNFYCLLINYSSGGVEPFISSIEESATILFNGSFNTKPILEESLKNPNFTSESAYKNYAENTQKVLGIYHESDSTISLNYISMVNGSRYNYENKTDLYAIPSYTLQNKAKVLELVQNAHGFSSITDFNAVAKEYCYIDGDGFFQREKIIRQALDFEYICDSATNSGTLNVIYSDYLYKDVALRVNNNDIENNLSLDVYTSTVLDNGDGTLTLVFNYEHIKEGIFNLCGWISGSYDSEGNFIPGFTSEMLDLENPNPSAVALNVGEKELTITFAENNQNALFGLKLDATLQLIPDVDMPFSFEYIELDNNLNKTVKTSSALVMKYSDILAMGDKTFYNTYGDIIEKAISPDCLNGQSYMTYKGILKNYDSATEGYIINVLYDYSAVIRFRNNVNEDFIYKVLDKTTLNYVISDFVSSAFIPNGWRIAYYEYDKNAISLTWNETSPIDSSMFININTSTDTVLEVIAVLSDKWALNVEYFEQYKNTPFFEKVSFETEIRVLDYGDIYALTIEDIKTIMNKQSFELLGLTTIENIEVRRVGDVFNVITDYTDASLKKINYNGVADEVIVPITKYTDWTAQFGKNWSILMLNNENDKWFNYANDVDINKLYGLFSVVVFEERVSDIEYIFRDYTYNGCVVEFQTEEVSGSSLYNFFHNTASGSISAQAGMFLCELFNEENKIYNSHFFYLDGTTDLPFASNSGATSYDDEDSASQNKWQDFTAGLAGVWEDVDAYVVLIASIVVAVVGLVLTIKWLSKIWVGEMQVVFKIILTLIFVALWVLAGIFGVPWVIDLINTLGGL